MRVCVCVREFSISEFVELLQEKEEEIKTNLHVRKQDKGGPFALR